jgi:predicted nucleic acid-binding protein
MKAVFVDTSALYALYSPDDELHDRAVFTLRDLHRQRSPLVTTNFVMIESYVLVHARGGPLALLEFRSAIATSAWLEQVLVTPEQETLGWSLLERRRDKGYSFVDATSFVVMRALGIQRAFSFDAHFSQEGFEILVLRSRDR